MRYLVLSDIHANLEALETCWPRPRALGYDASLVLGDLVGYGADPNAVVERVRDARRRSPSIRGNHDKVGVGPREPRGLQRRGPQRHPLDLRRADAGEPRLARGAAGRAR